MQTLRPDSTDACAVVSLPTVSSNATVDVTSAGSNSFLATSSSALNDYLQHVSNVRRPSAPMMEVSSVLGVAASENYQSNHILSWDSGLTGTVWRKYNPRDGRWGAVTASMSEQCSIKSVSSSAPALNDMISLSLQDSVSRDIVSDDDLAEMQSCVEHGVQHLTSDLIAESQVSDHVQAVAESITGTRIDNMDRSHSDADALQPSVACESSEMKMVDGDGADSSHSETAYDLTDNNVVTVHQLRDDIPDSELIDYSDDGSESLVDSSTSTQVQIFIALFDYDPATMSPNPDAVESELPFSEGQLIKVGFCSHV